MHFPFSRISFDDSSAPPARRCSCQCLGIRFLRDVHAVAAHQLVGFAKSNSNYTRRSWEWIRNFVSSSSSAQTKCSGLTRRRQILDMSNRAPEDSPTSSSIASPRSLNLLPRHFPPAHIQHSIAVPRTDSYDATRYRLRTVLSHLRSDLSRLAWGHEAGIVSCGSDGGDRGGE